MLKKLLTIYYLEKKNSHKLGTEETSLKLINIVSEKLKTNIQFNAFSSRSGKSLGCSLSPLPFNIVLEAPSSLTGNEIKMQGIQNELKVQLPLFADNVGVYTENSK